MGKRAITDGRFVARTIISSLWFSFAESLTFGSKSDDAVNGVVLTILKTPCAICSKLNPLPARTADKAPLC